MIEKKVRAESLYLEEMEDPSQRLESVMAEEFHKGDIRNVSREAKVLEYGEYHKVVGPRNVKKGASI